MGDESKKHMIGEMGDGGGEMRDERNRGRIETLVKIEERSMRDIGLGSHTCFVLIISRYG